MIRRTDDVLRQRKESLFERAIVQVCNVARELQMLDLIFTNWNMRRMVQKDIGGLKNGVCEQAQRKMSLVHIFLGLCIADGRQFRLRWRGKNRAW